MKNKIKSIYKNYRLFIFGYIPFCFLIFLGFFLLLRFPEIGAKGAKTGIETSLTVLIPSLFPFMVLSTALVNSGLMSRLKSYAGPAFMISLLGGYPLGAKTAEELYISGNISLIEAQRLFMFCFNPAPSFVIVTVGHFLLGERKAGIIIYFSIILSSAILGVVLKLLMKNKSAEKYNLLKKDMNFSEAFLKAVKKSSETMLMICAFVVLFSALGELISIFPLERKLMLLIRSVLEISGGVVAVADDFSVPLLAAIISLGGLCTHFQIMPFMLKLKVKYSLFLIFRTSAAALSFFICRIIIRFVPISYETFATGVRPKATVPSYSIGVSIGLILLAIFFILGDNYVFSKKKKLTK